MRSSTLKPNVLVSKPASGVALLLTFLSLIGFAQSAGAQASDHMGQVVVRVRDRHSESSLERTFRVPVTDAYNDLAHVVRRLSACGLGEADEGQKSQEKRNARRRFRN